MILSHALRAVSKEAIPASNPVFQSATTASKASGTTLTINKPTSVASGDLLIAVLVANQTDGWNQLSGWTRLNNIVTDPSTSIQFRIADGTEGASFGFVGADIRASGTVMRFTGAGRPYNGSANSSAAGTTPHIAPSVTVGYDLSLALNIFTSDTAGITWTGVDGTNAISFSTQCSFNIGYSEVNSGATAADTATPSSACGYASLQLVIPSSSAPDGLSVSYVATYNSTNSAATTVSISGVSFGAEDSTRRIYISLIGLPNASVLTVLTSATIGGTSATIIATDGSNSTGVGTNALIAVELPTGTSGTVSLTFSNNVLTNSVSIFVYRVLNQLSTIASALEAEVVGTASSTSASSSVLTAANGFMIGLIGLSAARTVTFTNMPINSGGSSSARHSGAQSNTSGDATTYTFSWTTATGVKRYFVSLKG